MRAEAPRRRCSGLSWTSPSMTGRGNPEEVILLLDRLWQEHRRAMLTPRSSPLVQALLAHIEVFFPPLRPEAGAVLAAELGERRFDGVSQALDGPGPVAMRPAQGLRHDFVDDTELEQVVGGHLQRLRRLLRLGAIAPEDGGAALR